MSFANRLILAIKRAESPGFRFLKRLILAVVSPTVPRWPRLLRPVLRGLYESHFLLLNAWRTAYTLGYRGPLFQARCATFGKGVRIEGLPFVSGHVELHVGDRVLIGGKVSIMSGRMLDRPQLVLKDRSSVGWNTTITVNREVVIEEDVIISYDCRISDSDGHPREADLRAAAVPPDPRDIRPVRICARAFVGNGTHVMKGVTIGEGAIIGANSVVISDVPPYALAMGNPAEVFMKNYGLPSTARRKTGKTPGAAGGGAQEGAQA